MFIRARSFFLSALVGAAWLTAVGCAEDPTADDPVQEIDPAGVRQTRPIDPVPADPASLRPIRPWDATRPVRPMPRPVDPPRDPLTVPAPISAPTISVPGDDEDDLVDGRGIADDMPVQTGAF